MPYRVNEVQTMRTRVNILIVILVMGLSISSISEETATINTNKTEQSPTPGEHIKLPAYATYTPRIDAIIESALKAKSYDDALLILKKAMTDHKNAPDINRVHFLHKEYLMEKGQMEKGLIKIGSKWVTEEEMGNLYLEAVYGKGARLFLTEEEANAKAALLNKAWGLLGESRGDEVIQQAKVSFDDFLDGYVVYSGDAKSGTESQEEL